MNNYTEEIINKLLSQSKEYGFEEAEVYYEEESAISVQVLNGEVSVFEESKTNGLSFRGKQCGQMGYAFTEKIDDDVIPFLLSQAKDNCQVLEVKENVSVYEGETTYPKLKTYNEDLEKIGYQELASSALILEKSMLDYDKRIIASDYCSTAYADQCVLIMNTKGMRCFNRSNHFAAYASCRAQDGEDVQTAEKGGAYIDYNAFHPGDLARDIAKMAIDKLNASNVSSDKYPVVIDTRAASDILEAFSGNFSADAMQKGISLLGKNMDKQIAAKFISIRDVGIVGGSIESVAFDSEGVLTKDTILVDCGILISALHNRKTASKAGVISTGNGFRSGYKGSIGIQSTHLFIEPGKCTLNELIETAKNGIYITDVSGLHAGVNAISGDFSLLCEGFLIKDGKIDRPLNQITISDNFYAILMKIALLGDDVDFKKPEANMTQSPSLLIPDVAISGE